MKIGDIVFNKIDAIDEVLYYKTPRGGIDIKRFIAQKLAIPIHRRAKMIVLKSKI